MSFSHNLNPKSSGNKPDYATALMKFGTTLTAMKRDFLDMPPPSADSPAEEFATERTPIDVAIAHLNTAADRRVADDMAVYFDARTAAMLTDSPVEVAQKNERPGMSQDDAMNVFFAEMLSNPGQALKIYTHNHLMLSLGRISEEVVQSDVQRFIRSAESRGMTPDQVALAMERADKAVAATIKNQLNLGRSVTDN